jgi:putative GTP pyrophosphokinase
MALVIEKTVVKGPAGSNLKNEVGEQLLQQFMDAGFVDMVRKNSMPWRELMAYYRCAMMEVETKFKVLNEQFSLLYDRNPIEAIKSRMKTMESIAEKMDRKGFPFTIDSLQKDMHDIAGVRIVCSFPEDIYMLADTFLAQDYIVLLERRDYIQNPKDSGYRSLHLIVEVPIFLEQGKKWMKVEVQLRTIAMDFWASLEHKIRYKKDIDPAIADELAMEMRACAEVSARLDRRMEAVRRHLEELESLSKHPEQELESQ